MRYTFYSLLCLAAFALPLAGCGGKPAAKKPDAHEHEHDHDHAHEGPHGGHILELGDEEYHAEWTHDDAGKIDVYILDKDMKEVPVAAEKMVIKTKVNDMEKDYELEAVNAAEGKASQFSITDKSLANILTTVGEKVEAALDASIDGKAYSQKFEAHDHHGHKH
jgi:hypothetical protein